MKKLFVIMVLAALVVSPAMADKPGNMTGFDSIWIGAPSTWTDDPSTTPSTGDAYISGDLVVGGGVDISGAALRGDIYFPLGAAAIDGSNDVDDATTPILATVDSVPAIIWKTSDEVSAAQWTFRVPSDYSSGMLFYALVSSDDSSGQGTQLDFALTQHGDDLSFASPVEQDSVECTSASLAVSNEVLTLTPDDTGQALFTAGKWITLEVFNCSRNNDDLELKGLHGTYIKAH